jgi:hypothetical protein
MTNSQNASYSKPEESQNDARRYKSKSAANSYSMTSGQFVYSVWPYTRFNLSRLRLASFYYEAT